MNIHQKPELYSDDVTIAQNVTYPFPRSGVSNNSQFVVLTTTEGHIYTTGILAETSWRCLVAQKFGDTIKTIGYPSDRIRDKILASNEVSEWIKERVRATLRKR